MRTIVDVNEQLLMRAQEVTGIQGHSALLKEALRRLVEDEAARRLILLGDGAP